MGIRCIDNPIRTPAEVEERPFQAAFGLFVSCGLQLLGLWIPEGDLGGSPK
jgi:hypothetical protein